MASFLAIPDTPHPVRGQGSVEVSVPSSGQCRQHLRLHAECSAKRDSKAPDRFFRKALKATHTQLLRRKLPQPDRPGERAFVQLLSLDGRLLPVAALGVSQNSEPSYLNTAWQLFVSRNAAFVAKTIVR